MQNGLMVRAGALVLASTLALASCNEPASNEGAGGGAASSGGAGSGGANIGGAAGASNAGTAGGGASSGGANNAGTGGGSSCSGESGGTGGGSSVTSIPGSCPLNTLSGAQVTQLCDDTGTYVAGAISKANACKYAALVSAASSSSPTEEELQAFCSEEESACNEDASSMGPGVLCTEIPPTCTATVAQYSTCITDETMLFEQGVGALSSCSMLGFDGISTIYEVPDDASQAASCMALSTMCPGFFPPYIN